MHFFSTYLSTALNSDRECSQHWAVAKQGRRSLRSIGANRCSMFVEPQMSLNDIAFSIVVQLPPPQLHMHSKTEGSCLFALMRGRLRSPFATNKKKVGTEMLKRLLRPPLTTYKPDEGTTQAMSAQRKPCQTMSDQRKPCLFVQTISDQSK